MVELGRGLAERLERISDRMGIPELTECIQEINRAIDKRDIGVRRVESITDLRVASWGKNKFGTIFLPSGEVADKCLIIGALGIIPSIRELSGAGLWPWLTEFEFLKAEILKGEVYVVADG